MKLAISGGQSGADLGALQGVVQARPDIAISVRIFNGFKPVNRAVFPDWLRREEIVYLPNQPANASYVWLLRWRTADNVRFADATVIFVHQPIEETKGSKLTADLALGLGKPCLLLSTNHELASVVDLRSFLARSGAETINFAGQRTCNEKLVASIVAEALHV